MSCDGSQSAASIATSSYASSASANRGGGCCVNPVVFNDGEMVLPESRRKCGGGNNNNALEDFFELPVPHCVSRNDTMTVTESLRADELLVTNDAEKGGQQQQQKGEQVIDDHSSGAFGLMERDESSRIGMNKKILFSRKTASNSYSSPKRVSSFQRSSGATSTTSAAQQQEQTATREPIPVEVYCIGDEAKLEHYSYVGMTQEEAVVEAKALEVGDAAFILRSDRKWTYSKLINKAVVEDGQVALRFEVGSDQGRKTFMEGQWGKYVRAIKMISSTEKTNSVEERTEQVCEPATADLATKSENASEATADPDIQEYESDSEESLDDDNEDDNKNAVKENNSPVYPKGILRNKSAEPFDIWLKSKVVEKKRSEGVSVHFNINNDDDESWSSDAIVIEQAFGAKKDEQDDEEEGDVVSEPVETAPAPIESKIVDAEVEITDINNETLLPSQDDSKAIISEKIDETFPTVHQPVDKWSIGQYLLNLAQPVLSRFNCTEEQVFGTRDEQQVADEGDKQEDAKEEGCDTGIEIADINGEMSASFQDESADGEKEDSVMNSMGLFNCDMSPIRKSPTNTCPQSQSKIGESWEIFNLALPGLTNQLKQIDLNSGSSQEQTLASAPSKDVVPNEEVVDETLKIECELQNTADVKVHEVHYTCSLVPAVFRGENENELPSANAKVRISSLPPTVFGGAEEDALYSANALSMLKRDALDIEFGNKGKGSLKEAFVAMSDIPTLSKREEKKSFKNKLVASVSRVRSSKKVSDGKKGLDHVNITADTIDTSYEVYPEEA